MFPQIELTFIECLFFLGTVQVLYVISFDIHNDHMKKLLQVSSYYKQGNGFTLSQELECGEFIVRSSDSQAEDISYQCHFNRHMLMRGRWVDGCSVVKMNANLEQFEKNRFL